MRRLEKLKRVPGIQGINATRRAWQLESRYQTLGRWYSGLNATGDFASLWREKGLDRAEISRRPRVLFCGTDPLQDFGGFIQALEQFCDLRLLYRAPGEYGQAVNGITWSVNGSALDRTIEELSSSGWCPEILLMQSMGSRFHPSDLQRLKNRHGFIIVNIGMDERQAYRLRLEHDVELGISGLNSVVDLALVTVPEAVHWYAVDGVPAKYFPLASSAEIYFPQTEVQRTHDVGFVGRAYGRRLELARKISRAGASFRAHGPGWSAGSLDTDAVNRFYNSCRIVLGSGNIGHSKRMMNPKLRDFEAPLTGVLYVTNYTPELAELYDENAEIVLYRDEGELLEKLRWLLDDPELAARIGRAGLERALSDHQYVNRFEVLFHKILQGDDSAEFVAKAP